MAFALPPLPYPNDALEPYMSAKTLDFHHGKHHKTFVDTLNRLVEGKPEANMSLERIITATHHDNSKTTLFNNAAQAWNHAFFWSCMTKGGGGDPRGEVKRAIDHDFGSSEKFAKEFQEAAATQFGSGWAWLVFDAGRLKVIKTANAINPVAGGLAPLLTCNVWEHAYYLDYQNRRPDFVEAFLDHLINWEFVARNLEQARERHG